MVYSKKNKLVDFTDEQQKELFFYLTENMKQYIVESNFQPSELMKILDFSANFYDWDVIYKELGEDFSDGMGLESSQLFYAGSWKVKNNVSSCELMDFFRMLNFSLSHIENMLIHLDSFKNSLKEKDFFKSFIVPKFQKYYNENYL
jgi:hypothetical protein